MATANQQERRFDEKHNDDIELRDVSLDDKYSLSQTQAYLNGVEALVRLPILQHQRDQERGLNTAGFVSGYRGSPLGGVDQAMWKAETYLSEHNIKFVPGVNEELGATAVQGSQEVGLLPGSQFDGVFGMWYGKGPGLDRSIDAFRHANAAGTSAHGGVLAVVGDDHGCKSSTYPYQSEHIFTSLSMPVLAPANVQEVLDLGIYGWELSRYCGCWVGLKAITENMDSAISAEIDPNRIDINIPTDFEMPEGGVNIRWPDAPLDQEARLNKYKIYAALAFARENELNKIVIDTPRPKLGILTSGKSYLDVLQAFDDLGITEELASRVGIRVYKVGMPWPLEPVKTHEFAEGLNEILVVEEKRSVMEDQLTGQLYNWPVDKRPRVVGEYDENGADLLTNLAELTPAMIAKVIAERLKPTFTSDLIEQRIKFIARKERTLAKPRDVSIRQATFCSGCPHNTSTQVPDGSYAGGGIGCHYMAIWSATRPAHNFTQMGGEGANWVGMAHFTELPHLFQNLGDGTYFHSGILAIRQAVSAGVNITYKILYNEAVAMTGGQQVDGSLTMPELVVQLKGEGIKRIEIVSDTPENHTQLEDDVVTVSHRKNLNSIQQSMRESKGCTVLIYQQPCATEKRRKKKRGDYIETKSRVFINEAVCEGCGDCSTQSNCLSVVPNDTELGRKRKINQAGCNLDQSCLNGFCPSFVTVDGGELRKPTQVKIGEDDLPTAFKPDLDQPWNVVVTGVGGTGVLTVTAVLSMAAHLEGKGVATMNQTGLAQKFGPVVSHLRIAEQQADIHAVRIPAGDADLVLGSDLLVAASDDALAKMHLDRTYAVVNDTISPTVEFVNNPDAVYNVDAMKRSIEHELSEGHARFLPAGALSDALLGDPIATNLFLAGYAYQQGLLPVSAKAINKALELNGVRVSFNQQAFYWGRRAFLDQPGVEQLAGLTAKTDMPLQDLDAIIDYRYKDLNAYQNKAYADEYAAFVNQVRDKEKVTVGGDKLTIAVARSLHKLMAIKDEYEIGRLYTDGRFMDKLSAHFKGKIQLNFYFASPTLSVLFGAQPKEGKYPQKRRFGHASFYLLKLLAKLKFLRGTKLDIFAYSHERKMERQLLNDFKHNVDLLLADLHKGNHQLAVDIIESVQQVRGFGHVKHANYLTYQKKLGNMMSAFKTGKLDIHSIKVEVADVV